MNTPNIGVDLNLNKNMSVEFFADYALIYIEFYITFFFKYQYCFIQIHQHSYHRAALLLFTHECYWFVFIDYTYNQFRLKNMLDLERQMIVKNRKKQLYFVFVCCDQL